MRGEIGVQPRQIGSPVYARRIPAMERPCSMPQRYASMDDLIAALMFPNSDGRSAPAAGAPSPCFSVRHR